jgi:hypothetical protein
MAIEIAGQVGPQTLSDGNSQPFRQGRSGEIVMQELHGRFYEQAYRAAIFTGGMTALTTIAAATFTTATTGATATPIVGLWNPVTSPVNLVVLQAQLATVLTALTATGGGPFVWMTSIGNSAITTGNVPVNRKTLNAYGSYAKVFGGAALTGMTGTLTALTPSAIASGPMYSISSIGTAAGFMTAFTGGVENFDGSLIVPPGGVLALMAVTTPVAQSAVAGITWEEVAL